jgi:hypothetical protein
VCRSAVISCILPFASCYASYTILRGLSAAKPVSFAGYTLRISPHELYSTNCASQITFRENIPRRIYFANSPRFAGYTDHNIGTIGTLLLAPVPRRRYNAHNVPGPYHVLCRYLHTYLSALGRAGAGTVGTVYMVARGCGMQIKIAARRGYLPISQWCFLYGRHGRGARCSAGTDEHQDIDES